MNPEVAKLRMEKMPAGSVRGVIRLKDCPVLANLALETTFDYRILYRITSLAMRYGGILEACNEEIAILGFPDGGILDFLEVVGLELKVSRYQLSSRERGISKVNLRFVGKPLP
jgi:hypothetical protein